MQKKFRILLGTVLLVLILITLVFFKAKKSSELTALVEQGPIIESVYGIGTITANKTYVLKVSVANSVREVMVKEGDQVDKGHALVLLEDTPLVRAPFGGTITAINYKPGETVTPNSNILQLVDMQDRYLLVSLEQQGAVRVQRHQKARLNFESMRDRTFDGLVESVFSHQGQFFVRVSGKNLPKELLPGMTMDVAIEINRKDAVLIAPVAALKDGMLTKIEGGRKISVPVQSGIIDADKFEIVSGDIKANDTVLISTK